MFCNILGNTKLYADINEKPEGWNQNYPRELLKPHFSWNETCISVSGNNNPYVFGYWSFKVDVVEKITYKFRVKFKTKGIEDINLHVLNMICWLRDSYSNESCPHDHISYYTTEDGWIAGEDTFVAPDGAKQAEIQLGLRYSMDGAITWKEVSLFEGESDGNRPVKVSAVKWQPYNCLDLQTYKMELAKILDTAGFVKSDIVVLPEFTNRFKKGIDFDKLSEKIPEGVTCEIIAEKARQYKMNICAALLESDNGMIFNTAAVFDRQGELVGKYRKTHLYWPESIFFGESPGDDFPIFNLDFGKVGIMICYDNWYGETARLLALKGAELILYPNEGFDVAVMPARAIDNRVYIAVSSLEMPSIIFDTKGDTLSQTANEGLITTEIDLNYRPTPYPCSGGTLNSSAGGRRSVRNSVSNKLYSEILKEISVWENRPENFRWFKDNPGSGLNR